MGFTPTITPLYPFPTQLPNLEAYMKYLKRDYILSFLIIATSIFLLIDYSLTEGIIIGLILAIINLLVSFIIKKGFNGYILKHQRRIMRLIKRKESKWYGKILIWFME